MNIAEELYKHAQSKYSEEGWDFVVECWTVDEIEEELNRNNITTLAEAIKLFGETYGIINEQREEAKSYIF